MAAVLIGINNAGDVRAAKIFLAGLAIFAFLSFFRLDDGGAISLLAISAQKTIFTGEANGAFLAIFAVRGILAKNNLIIEFQVIGNLAGSSIFLLCQEQVAFFFIRIVPKFSISNDSRSFYATINGNSRMGRSDVLYFLQVSYIDCIVQHISTGCCQIYRVAGSIFQTTVNMRNLIATIAEALVGQGYR